jgi:short chain dehydrogenase
MNLDNCTALITGASAGIGHEIARQLASRAQTLVLVARREQRLSEVGNALRNQNPQLNVHTRLVDLCDKTQIDELVRWLGENKIDIDFLINNAGLGDVGPFTTSDPQRNAEMLQVNVAALTMLTRALLPQMISRARFRLCKGRRSCSRRPRRNRSRQTDRHSRFRYENWNVPRPDHADADLATGMAIRNEALKQKAAVDDRRFESFAGETPASTGNPRRTCKLCGSRRVWFGRWKPPCRRAIRRARL